MEKYFDCDIAKEFLTFVSYCEKSFIDNIPSGIIQNLVELAADSTKSYFVDKNKSLVEQEISEGCKNLIISFYYSYMMDSLDKANILDEWLKNELE